MATSFPSGLDSFVNPSASDALDSGVVPHAAQHSNVNDAVEALEAKVGVDGSAVTSSLDYKVSAVEDGLSVARPLLTDGAYIDGTNGLVLSGLSGNYASTPDSAALSVTGDIDIKVKLTMADWTPTSTKALVAKHNTAGNQRAYLFRVDVGGILRLYTSPNGTAIVSSVSTSPLSFADNETKWVRMTMDVDDGSGNRVVKFYTSDDGSSWSQLGTTVTSAGTTSIYDSTVDLTVGAVLYNTSEQLNGTIHRVIIQDAYDTANNTSNVVFDADFEAEAADTLAFTEDSTNAATVSVVTTRYTVGLPGMGAISSGTNNITNDIDYFAPFHVTQPIETDMLAFEVTTAPSSTSTVYAAIYSATDDYQPTGTPLASFGPISVATGTTGVYYAQITPVTLPPGQYVLGFNDSVAFVVRSIRYPVNAVHTFSSNTFPLRLAAVRANGAFPSSSAGWGDRLSTSTTGLISPALLRWKAV